MKKNILALTLAVGAAMAGPAGAQWTGNAEIGFSNTTGNTETSTANLKVDLNHVVGSWRHNLFGESFYSDNNSIKSAERYMAGYKHSYFLSEKNYMFCILRYDQDRFAFINSRFNEVLGYGRQVFNTRILVIDGEIGFCERQTDYVYDPSTADLKENNVFLFLWLKYNVKIS